MWKQSWNENIVTGVQRRQIWNLIKTLGIKKDLIDKYPKHNNINNTEQHIEYKINYIFERFNEISQDSPDQGPLGLVLKRLE